MIITSIPAVDNERYQETEFSGFCNSILNKSEKINLGVIVYEMTLEKTRAKPILLFPSIHAADLGQWLWPQIHFSFINSHLGLVY